ncbi:MAG: hypothetical protein ABIJ09_17445 [Pseudomonadota bacterium]
MTVADLIQHYGYLAVLGGSLIQSETLLLSAGVAAHHGLLDTRVIAAIYFLGAFTSATRFGASHLFHGHLFHGPPIPCTSLGARSGAVPQARCTPGTPEVAHF